MMLSLNATLIFMKTVQRAEIGGRESGRVRSAVYIMLPHVIKATNANLDMQTTNG